MAMAAMAALVLLSVSLMPALLELLLELLEVEDEDDDALVPEVLLLPDLPDKADTAFLISPTRRSISDTVPSLLVSSGS